VGYLWWHLQPPTVRYIAPPPEAGASGWVAGVGLFARMALLAAGRALVRNKMHSALTMLGVFIGVAALIAMVAVGQGATAAVEAQIESLGTNLLVVLPGATTGSGVRSGFGSASTLTVSDADAIKKQDSIGSANGKVFSRRTSPAVAEIDRELWRVLVG